MEFMSKVLSNNTNYLMNLSTTAAPEFDFENKLVNLHINGLFYDKVTKTTHVTPNTVFPPRYNNSHSNQFWIH